MRFFSILSRYFLKSFAFWFFIISFSIISIISLIEMVEILRVSDTHVKISKGIQISFLRALEHFSLLIPFFIFFASLATMLRLNENKEIIIFKTLGISFKKLSKNLILFMAFSGISYLFILTPILASLHSKLVREERVLFPQKRDSMSISNSGIWIRENNSKYNRIFNAKNFDFKSGVFFDVMIFEIKKDFINSFFYSKQAKFENKQMILLDGRKVNGFEKERFDKLSRKTHLSLETLENLQDPPEAFSFLGLFSFIKKGTELGMSMVSYKIHLQNYIGRVLMMISMAVLGLSITWNLSRFKKSVSIISIGILLSIVIHFCNNILIGMGANGRISIILACYSLPIITLLIAFSIVLHQED